MNPTALYSSVSAGSPSPIDDGEIFDLIAHLIRHPQDTFYVRVSGDSMSDARINDGDILVIDQKIEPCPLDIVVAQVEGGFTVKQFKREQGRLRLVPRNPNHKPIDSGEDARICGVATYAIVKL